MSEPWQLQTKMNSVKLQLYLAVDGNTRPKVCCIHTNRYFLAKNLQSITYAALQVLWLQTYHVLSAPLQDVSVLPHVHNTTKRFSLRHCNTVFGFPLIDHHDSTYNQVDIAGCLLDDRHIEVMQNLSHLAVAFCLQHHSVHCMQWQNKYNSMLNNFSLPKIFCPLYVFQKIMK